MFRIKDQPLFRDLERLVSKKTSYPITSNILFEFDGENLYATATDMDVVIRGKLEVETTEKNKGAFCINGSAFISLLEAGELTLVINDLNKRAEVRHRYGHYTLPVLPPNEFPSFRVENEIKIGEIDFASFKQALKKAIYATGEEGNDLYTGLSSVLLEFLSYQARAVSTDCYRLAMGYIKSNTGESKVLIYPRSARILAGLGMEKARVSVSQGYILFENESRRILVRILDGTFPDYQMVLDEQGRGHIVTVDGKALLSAARRITEIATPNTICLEFSPGKITINAEDLNGNTDVEEIEADCDYSGRVFLNPAFFIDALRQTTEGKIRILVIGPLIHIFILSNGYTAAVMPCRPIIQNPKEV